jgi:hypothetical protein
MSPEFAYKLGLLLGSLNDFMIRVEDGTLEKGDVDRIRTLMLDVQKKFFAMEACKK